MSESLLLDTNVVIRILADEKKIPVRVSRALNRQGTPLLVSVVSVWEMVLKHQVNKLRFRVSLNLILEEILYHSPWTILPLTAEHLLEPARLPALHSDPFGRMLIAQALHDELTIVTSDEKIPGYNVRTFW